MVGGVLGTPHGLIHLLWVVSALASWQRGGATHLGPPALSLWALSGCLHRFRCSAGIRTWVFSRSRLGGPSWVFCVRGGWRRVLGLCSPSVPASMSCVHPHPLTRGGARGRLPVFAFAEVVLAEVLVVIVFGGGFRGSWCLFGFVSAEY